jgi:hypothetical protein
MNFVKNLCVEQLNFLCIINLLVHVALVLDNSVGLLCIELQASK